MPKLVPLKPEEVVRKLRKLGFIGPFPGGLHIAKIAGADTNWYHCDALGSPRKMTNESGSVVWTGAYQPFGEMIVGSGDVHRFTGKELDETGLNYFCLRYYDSQIGRFITLDPFAGYIELPQTQNRYAYCINNPLKYIDPLGLDGVENGVWTKYPEIWFYIYGSGEMPTLTVIPYNWWSTLSLIQQREILGYGNDPGIGRPPGYVPPSLVEIIVLNLGNPGFENYRLGENGIEIIKEPSGSGIYGPQYTKATEFQRIISSYANWWNINYLQHGTTANPVWWLRKQPTWACADWSEALKDFLQGLDLRYYTVHQLNSPYDVPFPLFHSWIILQSESGFIWLDPWLYGLYFGIEIND